MGRDFTLTAYQSILHAGQAGGYQFLTFQESLRDGTREQPVIILRHDVDKNPIRSLRTAELEHACGISGTYYFRTIRSAFDPAVIRTIHSLGHEVGYHYEDLALSGGDHDAALASFERNLERVRQVAPVATICMHGSPGSRWDNRALWQRVSYARYGILGEPYFDTDFRKTIYLTDTGRRWDGGAVSVRDRTPSVREHSIRTTRDLAVALRSRSLGSSIMITVHPQRWTDALGPWLLEAMAQPAKNQIKRWIVSRQSRSGSELAFGGSVARESRHYAD